MLKWLFGSEAAESISDSILSCAKFIIDNGELKRDNSSSRTIPNVTFSDNKGNQLYVSWYSSVGGVETVKINGRNVPRDCDERIFIMAMKRIAELQKRYVEETIKSVKR